MSLPTSSVFGCTLTNAAFGLSGFVASFANAIGCGGRDRGAEHHRSEATRPSDRRHPRRLWEQQTLRTHLDAFSAPLASSRTRQWFVSCPGSIPTGRPRGEVLS